ncbi:MAG: hypothetical protein VYC03_02945, partial [Pseudomonadota bacterium]|nr:hypothetical protein [Pseudomonadota bacterium]
TVTLTGSLEEINGKLAGSGRHYEPIYNYDGPLPTDTDADGVPDDGAELIASVLHTNDYKGIYKVQGADTFYYQIDYHHDPETNISTASYAEVAYDGTEQTWSYVADGDQLTDINPSAEDAPDWHQSGALSVDVNVSHDGSGQYWAYEAITDTYQALRVEGLAVYEKDGERFEHDTALDTLSLLQPHYGSITWPQGWQSPSDATGLGTAVATGNVIQGFAVDVYYDAASDVYVAFKQDGTFYNVVAVDGSVPDPNATPIDTSAEEFDLTAYTKVSGLVYTGDGNLAIDTLHIEVRSGGDTVLTSDDVSITVTAVDDAPVVSGGVDLGQVIEDGSTLITEADLLHHATDVDTDVSGL